MLSTPRLWLAQASCAVDGTLAEQGPWPAAQRDGGRNGRTGCMQMSRDIPSWGGASRLRAISRERAPFFLPGADLSPTTG